MNQEKNIKPQLDLVELFKKDNIDLKPILNRRNWRGTEEKRFKDGIPPMAKAPSALVLRNDVRFIFSFFKNTK